MRLLAHRGFWHLPEQKNSRSAFREAFANGYGVELDVRDQAGVLVIAHDLPVGDCMTFKSVLDDYLSLQAEGTIAINIKADGLAHLVKAEVGAAGLFTRSFVFDMSVPDLMTYVGSGLQVFHRRSEIEPASAIEMSTQGVWLDFFRGSWANATLLLEQLWLGRTVAVVSPELHREPHLPGWSILRSLISKSGLPDDIVAEKLLLCTDYPEQAVEFFRLISHTR
jgi:hypothetical protein